MSGNLVVGGVATLNIDDTSAAVQTAFGGTLSRSGNGTLVIVPQNGHLFRQRGRHLRHDALVNQRDHRALAGGPGFRGRQQRNVPDLFRSGHLPVPATPAVSGSHTTAANELLDITGSSTITDSGSHRLGHAGRPLHDDALPTRVTLGSGGLILNGGTASGGRITGGALAFGGTQA